MNTILKSFKKLNSWRPLRLGGYTWRLGALAVKTRSLKSYAYVVYLDFVVPAVPGGRVVLLAASKWQGRLVRAVRTKQPPGVRPPLRFGATKAAEPYLVSTASTNTAASAKTNQFAYRLSNTTKTIGQLVGDRHAILLENALIDTASPLNFSIPKNLQSQGDPGAYIVQARGPIDNAFRAMLAAAGAEIVSYIPNDAYLVRAPAGVANGLAANPLTQAVIPYEPYYKISSSMPVTVGQKTVSSAPTKTNRAAGPSLLVLAVKQAPLPAGTYLKLGLFKDGAAATVAQIEKLGGQIVAQDNSPFGPVVRVQPPAGLDGAGHIARRANRRTVSPARSCQ